VIGLPRHRVLAAIVGLTIAFACPAVAVADGETVLCAVNEEECALENILGYGFIALSTNAAFDFGGGFVVYCISPMARSEAEVMALHFGSCTEECVVESKNLFYHADLKGPSEGDGILVVEDGGKGEPRFLFTCEEMECLYGYAASEFDFEGGEPANMHVSSPLKKQAGGILCPSVIKWMADYKITEAESAMYASHRTVEGPVLCKANEAFCAQKNTVQPLELFLWPELVLGKFLEGSEIACFKADGSLDNSQPFVPGGQWEYESTDPSVCKSPVFTECALSIERTPYSVALEPGEEGDGTLRISEGEEGIPGLSVGCSYLGLPFTCVYAAPEFSFEFNGSGEVPLLQTSFPLNRESGSPTLCPEVASLKADYEVSGPPGIGALYLTES
jgi:hypothetical protein